MLAKRAPYFSQGLQVPTHAVQAYQKRAHSTSTSKYNNRCILRARRFLSDRIRMQGIPHCNDAFMDLMEPRVQQQGWGNRLKSVPCIYTQQETRIVCLDRVHEPHRLGGQECKVHSLNTSGFVEKLLVASLPHAPQECCKLGRFFVH